MRGYDYLEFLGHTSFFANAELRFPLIEAMLTPIGVLGGLRGVLFANIGGAGFNHLPFRFMATGTEPYIPIIGYEVVDFFGTVEPVYGPPLAIDGLRLVDGRASYGFGLESSLLGFPMHFDWAWKTLLQLRLGRRAVRVERRLRRLPQRQRMVPQGAVPVLDRLRFLVDAGQVRSQKLEATKFGARWPRTCLAC